MQAYGVGEVDDVPDNEPAVVNAVNQMVSFCHGKIEALGELRMRAAQEMYGKAREDIDRMAIAGSEYALIHKNACVQRTVMAGATSGGGASANRMPCRVMSGPLLTARIGRMQTKVQRAIKGVARSEKERLDKVNRLERSQEAAMRKADAQHEKEEKQRQKEAAKRAKQQAVARKKRAAARAKLLLQQKKAQEAAARAAAKAAGTDILAMPSLEEQQAMAAAGFGCMEEEEEEEEEENVDEAAEDHSRSAERSDGPNWTDVEANIMRQIDVLEADAARYEPAMREVIAAAAQDEYALVTELANAIPGLAASGNAYAKEVVLAGVTALKTALLPDAPAAHLRPARAAAMRQSEAGGRRGPLCSTSGADHGTAVHESMHRIATAIPTCMRNGVPRNLDPCVVQVMSALRRLNLVLVGAEVPVRDVERASATRVDMVCVNMQPDQYGAVVLVELKTGSAGCFDRAFPGDPEITFTSVPGGSGPTRAHTEKCTPLMEAYLQIWLTMAMLQGSDDDAHGVRGMVMHLSDRYSQAACYGLPEYMYDAGATKEMYKRTLRAHLAARPAARLGLLAKNGGISSSS